MFELLPEADMNRSSPSCHIVKEIGQRNLHYATNPSKFSQTHLSHSVLRGNLLMGVAHCSYLISVLRITIPVGSRDAQKYGGSGSWCGINGRDASSKVRGKRVNLIECQIVQKKSTRDPSSEEWSNHKHRTAIDIL
jgi:hypothetical protein